MTSTRMKKHTKHTNLTRRENGNFAPNEIAILGTKCGVIADLVQQVSKKLSKYSLAYFDASHAKDVEHNQLSEFVFHHEGNLEIKTASNVNKFLQRLQFAQYDYVFINGNHYAGSKQIIFLDPEKEASIDEQIDRMRHSATRSLLERDDVIIVASVSCIYGLGSVEAYSKMTLTLKKNNDYSREDLIRMFVTLQYKRNDQSFFRGTFRVRGENLEIFPSHLEDRAWRLSFDLNQLKKIEEFDPLTGDTFKEFSLIKL